MKILGYSIMAMLIFIAISCNEEMFLKEEPRDNIFAENLFVNYEGFRNGLWALYALVRDDRADANNATRAAMWQIGCDNAFVNNGANAIDAFNDYRNLNSANGLVRSNFDWLYRIVNTANLIIGRAQSGEVDWQGSSETENLTNKNKVIAQASLVRAWAYRHLRYGWGAVPLSTEEISGSNYRNDWERNSVEEIYAQMEKDLSFARDHLEMREETGTVNSAVASHILAELYLAMGKIDLAENEALRVINHGEYELMNHRFGKNASKEGDVFSDIFDNPLPENGNKEVLWVLNNAYQDVEGSTSIQINNRWATFYGADRDLRKLNLSVLYHYNGGRGTGRHSVSDSAFRWYEPNDLRYSEHNVKKYYIYPENDAATSFKVIKNTNMTYKKPDELENHYLWPWVKKWEYVDPFVFENSLRLPSYDDQIFLRLSETYLLLAEAYMKQQKMDLAAGAINAVRTRSKATPVTPAQINIDLILKERSRELITEEYRRHTLIRTGKFMEWCVKYNPRLDQTKVQQFNELLPIPQTIIDSNTGSVMPQNPGYN